MDKLLAWRKEFPTCEAVVHLISHSLGAMPIRTRAALTEFADTWTNRGVRAWEEGWWEMPVTTGNLIGKIIGAEPGEITMHQNVSMAQGIVNSCFDWTARRNKVVTESMNFPTNLYGFHALERYGARLVTAPVEGLMDAIDEETCMVAVSHVLFRSSLVRDIAAIAKRAHEMGALMVADLYQSAGVYPVNVRDAGVDFATGGSVKWLCGGPGAGYLYVRRDLWPSLEPRLTGWMAHRKPFEFEGGAIDFADDSFRFLHGTPNIPALYAARSGYEIIAEIGVDTIRANSIRQTTHLIELALEAGFKVNSPLDPSQRGGVVIVDVPNGAAVNKELSRRDILVDYRPGAGIRIGPHFYNTDAELKHVIREMRAISDSLSA